MKNLKKMMSAALGGLTLALLMAGCADILNSPAAPEAKPGKVTLTVGGGLARTVAPDVDQFKKIILTFEGRNGSPDLEDADASDGEAEVTLPVGEWDVTAKAYLSAIDTTPAAASVAHAISWNGTTVSGNTIFALGPTGTGNGTLQYTVTVPVTLTGGSRIQIEADGAVLDFDDDGFTDGIHPISATEPDKNVSLPAGSYTVDILLIENGTGNTAVWRESVVILSGLVTKFEFAPVAGNFLDPDLRAILTDITDPVLKFGSTEFDEGDTEITPDFHDPASPVLGIAVPAETEMVYFILEKTVKHSVTVGGTDSAYVTIPGGFTNGSTPGEDLVVFAVDTSDIAATGGTKAFTLTVSNEGMAGVEVAVTVTVEAPKLGAGLYIDNGGLTAVPGFTWAGLQSALDWLGTGAVDDTEYVILLEEDEEITASYVSKMTSTGVKITLRGLEEERAVYWHEGTQFAGLGMRSIFAVLKGTTLVLDEYVNLGGGNGESYRTIGGTVSNPTLIVLADSALEMLPGSRISGVKDATLVFDAYYSYENTGATFTMNGGTIENNYARLASQNGLVTISRTNSTFEMFAGAEIRNNKTVSDNYSVSLIQGNTAAVFVNENGRFTMHGGAIKNNDMRGLTINKSGNNIPAFVMEAGEISGNGTGSFIKSGNTAYIRGAGIYINDPQIPVTINGSIKNNGNANSVGSGMFIGGSSAENNENILLNAVDFDGNTIAFMSPVYLGSTFENTGEESIQLEIGFFTTDFYPAATIASMLNTGSYIPALRVSSSSNVNIVDAINSFEFMRVYTGNTAAPFAVFFYGAELDMAISEEGNLSVAVK